MATTAPRRLRTIASVVSLASPLVLGPAIEARGAESPRPAAEASAEYVIGPADVLQVVVWREPELTREITVRLDGKVSVPLLGDVAAAGLTPAQFGAELTKALARFVESPRVTVGIAQANSSRFYVIGQVARPGEFPLTRRTTVLQALAVAGGFREFAKVDSIIIVRQDQSVSPVNYKRLSEGRDLSQNVVLRTGDTIVVP